MMHPRKSIPILALSLAMLATGASAHAAIFFDNFDGAGTALDPSRWNTPSGVPATSGFRTADPLESDKALTFSARRAGGDAFTSEIINLVASTTYRFSFDYLGTSNQAHGFAGLDWGNGANFPSATTEIWVGGVDAIGLPRFLISNNGAWNHYEFDFTTADLNGSPSVRLKFEDWNGVPGQVGFAYFDNVSLDVVPEPSSFAVMGLALFGFGAFSRFGKRKTG